MKYLAIIIATALCTAIPTWYLSSPEDCGITLREGVMGGTLSGFNITGHLHGICIYGARSSVVADNVVTP